MLLIDSLDNLDGDAGVGVDQAGVCRVGVPQVSSGLEKPRGQLPGGRVAAGVAARGSHLRTGVVDLHILVGVGAGISKHSGVDVDVA